MENTNTEESSPLLVNNHCSNDYTTFNKEEQVPKVDESSHDGPTAEGLPVVGDGSVVGEPVVGRSQWHTSLFACLGRNDEFCASDLKTCLLGSLAPCVLYGSNAEILGSQSGENFAINCLLYSNLCLLGNYLLGTGQSLAIVLSHRIAIRRRFNLEGSCEAFSRSCCGCCRCIVEDEVRRERCEGACDVFTHFVCHHCSLCQEGRELQRRLHHPGLNGRPVRVMVPPAEQTMGRGGI